jgi:hypothetical protein
MDLQLVQQALATLSDIESAERELLSLPQVDCPVVHHFGPGICIREVFMPAGAIAIGHRQKFDQLNIMIRGKVLIAKDDGTTQILTAPMIFTGKAGRKIGYVMEDMVWQNVYATDLKDASAVEDFFIEKSEQWHDDQASRFAVESVSRAADRNDYMLLLEECGIAHSQARQQSENEDDQMWVENSLTRVDISPIEGKGLFATADIKAGDVVCPARIDGKRTQAGRFTNHSIFPNAQMNLLPNGDIDLVAITDIEGCKGGSIGTEITIDYRQALSLSGIEFKQKEPPCLV